MARQNCVYVLVFFYS